MNSAAVNKQKLILVHNSLPSFKIAKLFPKTKWIYFGKEYLHKSRWETVLSIDLKIDYKEILTDVSYSLRDEFVEWSANLGRPYWKHWEWWITRLATRNNMSSPLYLYACYLEVLKTVTKQSTESLIVISESWELLDVISGHFLEKLSILKPFYWRQILKRNIAIVKEKLNFVFSWFYFFKKSSYEWLLAKSTRLNAHPKSEDVFSPNHIVIHTCINDACIGNNGKFKDRYYPGLAEYLRNKGMRVSTLIWFYNFDKEKLPEAFRWFRNNGESFLIPQDYYNLFDCFYSFAVILKSAYFRFSKNKRFFRGMDLLPLINYEQKLQSRDTGTAYFVNQVRMFYKWRILGYHLKAYVDFWELKNCEVPALFGIKKNYPLCKTVAFQHGALMPKLLFSNYKTTPDEFNASLHADIGIANSRINKEILAKDGFPESFIKLGPALRYKWLKEYGDSIKNGNARDGILVCLSLSTDISYEMLNIVYQALSLETNFKIWIKPHPMMNFYELKKRLSFTWPDSFNVIEGNIEKWLPLSKVVIVSQSSSMVDAVFLRTRTIIIGRETDIDIIALDIVENSKLWKVVYNSSQLRDVVNEFYNSKEKYAGENNNDFFEFDMDLLNKSFS
ncbi:hypothetical protein ACFLZ3_02220 [Candidatus Omnitrophota bacterium]